MEDDITFLASNSNGVEDTAEYTLNAHKAKTSTKFLACQISVFVITFLSYAMLHSSRKSLSNVKSTLSEVWSVSNFSGPMYPVEIWNAHKFFSTPNETCVFLGSLDAIFLFAYAVSLFISGRLGDWYNPSTVLFFGMMLTSISLFCFACLSEWFHLYNYWWYVPWWIMNAIAQSVGWPMTITIMGNWFSKNSRGFILGLWSSCASVGNIIGAEIAAYTLPSGYENVFFVNSVLILLVATIILIGLPPTPESLGLRLLEDDDAAGDAEERENLLDDYEGPQNASMQREHFAISFTQALRLPGVVSCSLSFSCMKLVSYSFFFWLPFYLHNNYDWTETVADQLSICFDIGGILGAVIIGFLSDRMKNRFLFVELSLLLSIPFLFFYSGLIKAFILNGFIMMVLGLFIGGATNIMGTAITADLGKNPLLQRNENSLSTVTGIIDGTGSFGAAFGQLMIPFIQKFFHWNAVFYMLMIMVILSGLIIVPMVVPEFRSISHALRIRRHSSNANDVSHEGTS